MSARKHHLYGIDGCRAGWLCVHLAPGSNQPTAKICKKGIRALAATFEPDAIVAIDIPIGLPDRDNPVRDCDRLARQELRARHVCVFSPPCREALKKSKHPDASAANRRILDRGLTVQAHALRDKLQEIDSWLRSRPTDRPAVHEIHPELSFAYWNGSANEPDPLTQRKKSSAGKATRSTLVEDPWKGAIERATSILGKKSGRWATDDLLDAFAALWSAERIASGKALHLPATSPPPTDAFGLPMRITI